MINEEIKEAIDKKKENTVFIPKCKNPNIKKGNNGNPIGYLYWKIHDFYGKNRIKLISKMTESQIDSNTDFAEQNNILNFSQQKQTLKC